MRSRSGASAEKCRSLFVSPEPPFPMIGGGPIRSASIFEFLAQRSEVDVITFRQPGDPDPRQRFPHDRTHTINVVDLPLHAKSAPARLLRNVRRALRSRPPLIDRFSGFDAEIAAAVAGQHYNLAVIEHFWCAQYEPLLRKHCQRLYLDLHNVESVWHAKLAASENPAVALIHKRFARASEALEKNLLPRFDALLVTSVKDAERVQALAPATKTVVYPNALPLIAKPPKSERNVIVFSGNLEYQPNISGIRYFRSKIWPLIRSRCPGINWEIIGKNPQAIRGVVKGDDQIHLIGPIDDAVYRIARAKVAVVPLLAGSGTRIKILEAWAAATPVVSTTIGAEGLECRTEENLIIADEPSAFADAVIKLLEDETTRANIGSAGRSQYEQRYTWDFAFSVLDRNLTC